MPARKARGEVPEWSIGAVSKTVERASVRGFESLSLRHFHLPRIENKWICRFRLHPSPNLLPPSKAAWPELGGLLL